MTTPTNFILTGGKRAKPWQLRHAPFAASLREALDILDCDKPADVLRVTPATLRRWLSGANVPPGQTQSFVLVKLGRRIADKLRDEKEGVT